MKKILIFLLLVSSNAIADPYIIFTHGQVTSWQHRKFKRNANGKYLAELDPIEVHGIPGRRYAIPLKVLSDSSFVSVWGTLSGFPTQELTIEDFQEK